MGPPLSQPPTTTITKAAVRTSDEHSGVDYDRFYRREFGAMVSLAATICGDYQQGEDVAQEAMARAHRIWHKISGYEKPGAWVRRVTINLSLSRLQRLKRELLAVRRVASDRSLGGGRSATSMDPADLGLDVEVWEAVKRLPPRQRAVVGLFYQHDLSTSEIAEALDCTVSTATSHLNQARTKLGRILADRRGDGEERVDPTHGEERR